MTTNIGYFVTSHFHYYGIINSGNTKIVIGPSNQVSGNDQELRELGFQTDATVEDMDEFVEGMKSIVCMPLESIMQMLCTINYICAKSNGFFYSLGLTSIVTLHRAFPKD